MEELEETVVDELVDDDDVGDRRAAPHQQSDVRVPENALHDNLILYFGQELIRNTWVENFLDRHWCAVEHSFVNCGESALTNLFSYLDVCHGDLADAGHDW